MHRMRDLLDRALAWPRRPPGQQPEITDPVKLHFFHISPLKAEDILTPEEVAGAGSRFLNPGFMKKPVSAAAIRSRASALAATFDLIGSR